MPAGPPRRGARRALLWLAALLVLAAAALAALWLTLPDPRAWAARNPPTTALMEQRRAEAARARRPWRPQQAWLPLDRISPRLVDAVVASEDAAFFGHHGFDWGAIREAARHDLERGRFARGASTISQQLAKNLWLGTEKSLLRKAREAALTARLERALGKRRILALYLNVAEWGDGAFGAEAGARRHLGTGAATLSTAQAVLLASMLPAPRRVDLARPPSWLRFRATRLLDRLRDEYGLGAEEHREASTELARLLQGPVPPGEPEAPPEEEPADSPADSPAEAPTQGPDPDPAPAETQAPAEPPTAAPVTDEGAAPLETGDRSDAGAPQRRE